MPGWLDAHLGTVRIDPKGAGAFVGIAPTRDVDAYLDQVAHDEITDLDYDPFAIETARRAGEGRPAMPTAQTFWAASATGGRDLEWKVRKGEWTVVVMNEDASPGVRVDAKVGAKVPLLGDLGWGLAIPGVALGIAALALIGLGARAATRTRELEARRARRRDRAVRDADRARLGRAPSVVSTRRCAAGAPSGRRRRRGRRRSASGRCRSRAAPSHDGPAWPSATTTGCEAAIGSGSP